jgi:hypothetical protein
MFYGPLLNSFESLIEKCKKPVSPSFVSALLDLTFVVTELYLCDVSVHGASITQLL